MISDNFLLCLSIINLQFIPLRANIVQVKKRAYNNFVKL